MLHAAGGQKSNKLVCVWQNFGATLAESGDAFQLCSRTIAGTGRRERGDYAIMQGASIRPYCELHRYRWGSFRRWPLWFGFNVIPQQWQAPGHSLRPRARGHYLNNELAGHIFSQKRVKRPVRTLRANYSAAVRGCARARWLNLAQNYIHAALPEH